MSDLRDRIAEVLTAHQRKSAQHCLCGWGELGASHPDHQAAAVIAHLGLHEEVDLNCTDEGETISLYRYVTTWDCR